MMFALKMRIQELLLWGGRLFIAWELVALARSQWRGYKENKENREQ